MNAVIPRPAERSAAVEAGSLPAAGPWRIRAGERLAPVAEAVRALLAPHLGERLLPGDAPAGPATDIVLSLDAAGVPPGRTVGVAPGGGAEPADEAYRLTVGPRSVICRARTSEGVFRAATTAAQLILTAPPDGLIGHQELYDAPRFAWRGLLIDPARCFVTADEVRQIIDVAALYKFNVLHLHLTDNEGWRLEIPSVPALTSPPPTAQQDGPGERRYYTTEEYRDLQVYAARRHITVVPEIDLPGHCAALRTALPELPPSPAPPGLAGRFPFVPPLDLTDADTHAAVSAVLADVCALTDGPFVHIGADEAVGITDESFAAGVRELRDLTRKSGKRPVAWQESSRAGTGPDDIAQFWVDVPMMDLPDTAEELAERPRLVAAGMTVEFIRALKKFFAPSDHDVERIIDGGGRLLLSPQSHLYLDRGYASEGMSADQAAGTERLGFPGYRPRSVRHTASWDPASYGIPEEQLAGVEATLFAHTLRGMDDLTTLLLPRIGSLAEAAWSGRAPEWDEYRSRIARHARMWSERGLVHFAAPEVPWP
ncbi:family 20 glycosylhydrolase [Streptomyces sp. NBC_01089]|uniref:family 20 glycosylhydrolase n=1 Tax=Streptomyces sp. NBC_01089 TaxID=2903747 RepID=UPI003866F50C|nr:beta-N-acetylhexosaminidase [Streptomyces sp. NBC_01089]